MMTQTPPRAVKPAGRVYLARTGRTDFDEQGRLTGRLEVPVSEGGQAELADTAGALTGLDIKVVYCAASTAAEHSAATLAKRLGVKRKILKDLHNIDFGLWQGLEIDEIRRRHRKQVKQWEQAADTTACAPCGESLPEVTERVAKALKPVLKRARQENVLLVAADPLRQVIRNVIRHQQTASTLQLDETPWEALPAGAE